MEHNESNGTQPRQDYPDAREIDRPGLIERTLADMIGQVRAIGEGSDGDAVLDGILLVKRLKQLVGEIHAEMEERAVAYLEVHDDLVCGDIRYYAGHRSNTVCVDVRKAVEAVLSAVGGDLDAFSATLASQPLKTGGCRSLLDAADFDQLFEKQVKQELKKGKPQKRLIEINERFVRKPAPTTAKGGTT